MPPPSKKRPVSPAQNTEVERFLTAKGFQWEFREGIGIEEFDEERSLHNQARVTKPLDKNTVERYVTVLNNGEEFPGIITAESSADAPLLIVDGNHRFQAMKSIGRKELDCYVVVGAKPTAITMLTFESNTRHGVASTDADRIHQALYLMDNGETAEGAARRLGLKITLLRSHANLAAVNRRADEAGINRAKWDKLPTSIKQRLGQISTDEGFGAMTKLVLDANLRTEDTAKAVQDINQLRSSTKQLEYVTALRAAFSGSIQTGGARPDKAPFGRQTRSPRTALGMCLGQVKILPAPETITERMTDDEKPEWIQRVEDALKVLTEVHEALKK